METNPERMIVLTDCDVVVTNFEVRVEELWEEHTTGGQTMMIARDALWRDLPVHQRHKPSGAPFPVNSGLVVMKPSDFTVSLMKDVLAKGRLTGTSNYAARVLFDQPR